MRSFEKRVVRAGNCSATKSYAALPRSGILLLGASEATVTSTWTKQNSQDVVSEIHMAILARNRAWLQSALRQPGCQTHFRAVLNAAVRRCLSVVVEQLVHVGDVRRHGHHALRMAARNGDQMSVAALLPFSTKSSATAALSEMVTYVPRVMPDHIQVAHDLIPYVDIDLPDFHMAVQFAAVGDAWREVWLELIRIGGEQVIAIWERELRRNRSWTTVRLSDLCRAWRLKQAIERAVPTVTVHGSFA